MTTETLWRDLLDEARRIAVPARIFGVYFPSRVEPYVFGIARSLSRDYDGGYWDFYALSNAGFYAAPSDERSFRVRSANGFDGELSADAFGIACCLHCYSHLSFARPEEMARACAEQYHLLREYMLGEHGEARAILAATD